MNPICDSLIILAIIGGLLLIYSCCKVAGDADRRMEQMQDEQQKVEE